MLTNLEPVRDSLNFSGRQSDHSIDSSQDTSEGNHRTKHYTVNEVHFDPTELVLTTRHRV